MGRGFKKGTNYEGVYKDASTVGTSTQLVHIATLLKRPNEQEQHRYLT